MAERLRINALRVLVVLALVAAWQAICELGWMDENTLPSATQTAAAIPDVLDHPDFWPSVRITLWQSFVTFALALSVGTILGVGMAAYRSLRKALVPYVVIANSFPMVLLYPILVIVLGLGTKSLVAIAVGLPTMVIALNTMEGLLGVPPVYEMVGHSLRASRMQRFLKVRLPAARILIFAGWRVALLYSFLAVIGVQFLTTGTGLGSLIIQYYDFFQTEELYASIVLVGGIAVLIELALMLAEKLVAGDGSGMRLKRTRYGGV